MTKRFIMIGCLSALITTPLLAGTPPALETLEPAVREDQAAVARSNPSETQREIARHEKGVKDAHAALRGANAAGKMVYVKQLQEAARRDLAYHQAALEALKKQ